MSFECFSLQTHCFKFGESLLYAFQSMFSINASYSDGKLFDSKVSSMRVFSMLLYTMSAMCEALFGALTLSSLAISMTRSAMSVWGMCMLLERSRRKTMSA